MLRNEKGFTYPATFALLLILSIVLMMGIEQFLTEKRMLKESETILKQDYYLLSTVKKLENDLAVHNEEEIDGQGMIRYSDGEVTYTIAKLTSSIFEIQMILKTGQEPVTIDATAYYDKDLQQIFKWIEKD